MTAPHADQILADYMARLVAALAPVAETRRAELIDEFSAHIAEARAQLPDETDADLLNILSRLGDPAEVAAAEIDRPDPPRRGSRALEIAAIVLLLVFWPVGVVLLWMSNAWTTRQKLIGTLLPPGGYLAILVVGPAMAIGSMAVVCETTTDQLGHVIASNCPSGGLQTAIDIGAALLVLFLLVAPVVTAIFLGTRMAGPRNESNREEPDESAPSAVPAG
jgi:hypothetical protein